MREPTAEEVMNSVSFTEKWYEHGGVVRVKRYIQKRDGTEEYLGEQITAYKEIPFKKYHLEE